METLSALLPFALILVAFYLLIIRPARTRQRAALALQQQLAPGVEIMTTSGIFGRVLSVHEDMLVLEVAPGTSIRLAKPAVARILSGDTATSTEDGDEAAPRENGSEQAGR